MLKPCMFRIQKLAIQSFALFYFLTFSVETEQMFNLILMLKVTPGVWWKLPERPRYLRVRFQSEVESEDTHGKPERDIFKAIPAFVSYCQ